MYLPMQCRLDRSMSRSRRSGWYRRKIPRCTEKGPGSTKQKGAGPAADPFSRCVELKRSALRELEAAAGLGAAVLLAFDHAAVASEEAGGLDRAAQRGREL